MNNKLYLITLTILYNYQTDKIWSVLNHNNYFPNEIEFLNFLKTLRKYKNEDVIFSEDEIQKAFQGASKVVQYCEENDIHIFSYEDEDYPKDQFNSLLEKERPILIYSRGDVKLLKSPIIGIVGTRDADNVYLNISSELSSRFASEFVVLSGLALGTDTSAHIGALNSSGKTIAVLANGLNITYPAANKSLAVKIVERGGLLISEYAPFTKIETYFFTNRNRLQAALSGSLIVIETGEKSGTMTTVKYAKIMNKKIFIIDPIDDGNKYNDVGNQLLITKNIGTPIGKNIGLSEYQALLNEEVKKEFKWKIIPGSVFEDETFQLENYPPVKKLPDNHLIIRIEKDVIVTILKKDY